MVFFLLICEYWGKQEMECHFNKFLGQEPIFFFIHFNFIKCMNLNQ